MKRNRAQSRRRSRLAGVERWVSLLGGSALVLYGLKRRARLGAAVAAAGSYLVFRGVHQFRTADKAVRAQAAFTINRPREELYRFWRDLENLPQFLGHIKSVRVLDQRRSNWVARGPLNVNISWDAEIVDEKENQWLVWRSLPGSDIESRGSVVFRDAPGGRGSEVVASLEYQGAGGKVGRLLAAVFGKDPERQIREDLRHFKQFIEAGEIPTTEGQPSGRRSAMSAAIHSLQQVQEKTRGAERAPRIA